MLPEEPAEDVWVPVGPMIVGRALPGRTVDTLDKDVRQIEQKLARSLFSAPQLGQRFVILGRDS